MTLSPWMRGRFAIAWWLLQTSFTATAVGGVDEGKVGKGWDHDLWEGVVTG